MEAECCPDHILTYAYIDTAKNKCLMVMGKSSLIIVCIVKISLWE